MSSADAVAFVLNLLERVPAHDNGTASSNGSAGSRRKPKQHANGSGSGEASLEDGCARSGDSGAVANNEAAVAEEAADDDDDTEDEDEHDETAAVQEVAIEGGAGRVALGVVCEMLLDECVARGSTDNVRAQQLSHAPRWPCLT